MPPVRLRSSSTAVGLLGGQVDQQQLVAMVAQHAT